MAREDRKCQPGERIAGTNYVVIDQPSSGGHGSLYRVRHYKLTQRISALKLLHADLRSNADLAQRMEREALIVSAMSHPNIVSVFDAGTTAEVDPDTGESCPRPFLAMEWLKGRSLAQVLTGVHGVGLGLHDALEIAIEVADALDYAHTRHGVVHRDIKPDNIFLQAASSMRGKTVTKLLDFGVASFLGAEKKITMRPLFLGTVRYASPEQIRGEAPTPQTDLYAFGLVLYEMLVGFGPFDDERKVTFQSIARAHLAKDPAPLPARDFPESVAHLVMQCLQKKASDRPVDASRIATQLREIKYKAEVERAKSLADLSRTDPSHLANVLLVAGGEATDPGEGPAGSPPAARPPRDDTARDSPASRHDLGRATTDAAALPMVTSVEPHVGGRTTNRQGVDTAVPSAQSLIDRLGDTRTSPPMSPAATRTDTDPVLAPIAPIDGLPVRVVGDRYVLDSSPPPPPALRTPTETILPPTFASATTTTSASALSLHAMLVRPVPSRYVGAVIALGVLGVMAITAAGVLHTNRRAPTHASAASPTVSIVGQRTTAPSSVSPPVATPLPPAPVEISRPIAPVAPIMSTSALASDVRSPATPATPTPTIAAAPAVPTRPPRPVASSRPRQTPTADDDEFKTTFK
jgi:serine/threonine protein kinase